MRWIYPKKISPYEKIVANKQYSYYYHITAPELTPELVGLALDIILIHFPEIFSMVLWGEPLKEDVEFLLIFREPSEFIGRTHEWFSIQIEEFAAEYYVDLRLFGVAIWGPRFPWWLLACFSAIGAVALGATVKKRKGG